MGDQIAEWIDQRRSASSSHGGSRELQTRRFDRPVVHPGHCSQVSTSVRSAIDFALMQVEDSARHRRGMHQMGGRMLRLRRSALAMFLVVLARRSLPCRSAEHQPGVRQGDRCLRRRAARRHRHALEPGAARTACRGHQRDRHLRVLRAADRRLRGQVRARRLLRRWSAKGFSCRPASTPRSTASSPVGGLQENVVVTGVNPIVDVRSTTQGTRFNVEELQAIPSARDVFQVLTQTPGIAGDRQNVGGTHNGQQTGMFSRGAGERAGAVVRRRRRSQRHRQRPSVRHRLQLGRRGAGLDRRRRRHHADARRVRQRRHQERIGRVPRRRHGSFGPIAHLGSTNVTDDLRAAGRQLRAIRWSTPTTTADSSAARSRRAAPGSGRTYGMQNVRLGVLNVLQAHRRVRAGAGESAGAIPSRMSSTA